MSNTTQQDGQEKHNFDQCLTLLAELLVAMGVEELTIEHNHQSHTINTAQAVDTRMVNSFCSYIEYLHAEMHAVKES